MFIKKMIATGIFTTSYVFSFAQEDSASVNKDKSSPSALTINGSTDFYYKYDFAKTSTNGLTSFTPVNNQFQLGMASLKAEYKTAKTDVVLDLGFGKRAKDFTYNDGGVLQAVKQAYISYMPVKNIKLTAGTWFTHFGYEYTDAYLNRNYSMSYMFTTGPFSHTGVRADFTLGKHSIMVGIANPTDYREVPQGLINRKAFIAQYGYAGSDRFNIYLNYVNQQLPTDTSKINQIDAVITSKLSDWFSIGYNGTIGFRNFWDNGSNRFKGSKAWWGSALYLNADPSKKLGITLREEYFNDKNSVTFLSPYVPFPVNGGLGGSIVASTLSFNLKLVDNLVVIPEFRIDAASQPVFINGNGEPTKTAAYFLVALTYHF